jgi:hypothetical protein
LTAATVSCRRIFCSPAVLAQHVQRGVARNRVQPRLQLHRLVGGEQRGVRVDERLLDRVLRTRLRQDPRAVAHERGAVAVDDRIEGALMAGAKQPDQPVIGLAGEDGAARQTSSSPAARVDVERIHGL